jgi:mRNA interferase RelE/StbE
MFEPRVLDEAERDLEHLDQPTARRIRKRIQWLAENLEHIKPEPLVGPLGDLFKLRARDYRVLYDVLSEDRIILIHRVRHRREVYREKLKPSP